MSRQNALIVDELRRVAEFGEEFGNVRLRFRGRKVSFGFFREFGERRRIGFDQRRDVRGRRVHRETVDANDPRATAFLRFLNRRQFFFGQKVDRFEVRLRFHGADEFERAEITRFDRRDFRRFAFGVFGRFAGDGETGVEDVSDGALTEGVGPGVGERR